MLVPDEDHTDFRYRPITSEDKECFAAWNRDPRADQIPNGDYIVQAQDRSEATEKIVWEIRTPDGGPVWASREDNPPE